MRYFYDTEFLEDGQTIDLISIGIVSEDGREYYAVNSDMDHDRIARDDWLCKNVVPHLPILRPPNKSFGSNRWIWTLDTTSTLVKPKWVIANEVRDFLTDLDMPDLWADYGAYDHVALCQLWGRMIHLPHGMPMFTHEFQQLWHDRGEPKLPEQADGQHDALADARHLKACFDFLQHVEPGA